MRLFAAVKLDDAAHAHLATALAELRPAAGAELRWADPATWHVTLAFYGEVPSDRAAELEAALTEAARHHHPVALRLRGAGTLNSALVMQVEGSLEPLARACRNAGRAAGVAADDRPYRPHLTVGRSRQRQRRPRDEAAALTSYVGPAFTPTELRLVRSHLQPRLRHEPIALLPLTGPRLAG